MTFTIWVEIVFRKSKANKIYIFALYFYFTGGENLGKFMDSFKQHSRAVRKSKGRRRYVNSFPWYDGSATKIAVTDAINPGERKETDIVTIEKGHKVGLLFELAGRQIITEITCPECGEPAKLNVYWPAWKCTHDNKLWEQIRHEQR
jgi:hypothetical protein